VRDYLISLFRSARNTQADALKAQQTSALELIDRGVVRIDQLEKLAPEARLALLRTFSDVYLDNNRPDRGVDVARRVVALTTELYGSTALATLQARAQLAHALGLMGARDEAVREIEAVLPELRAKYPDSLAYALALRTSAGILQVVNPALALARIEEAVPLLQTQVARAPDAQERSQREGFYAAALASLGVMQQTGGKLRESVESLQASIRLYDRLYGDRSPLAVSARSRLLYSLTVVGRIEEVIVESPKVIAGAAEHQDAPLTVPQARLYYGRALVLQGLYNDGRKQMELALAERSRFPVPTTSPRLDTFQGQVALIRVEQNADSGGMAALEQLLESKAGVPATRLAWHAALMRAYRQRGELAQALKHEAAARAIAGGPSAFGDMRLQFAAAAAPLYAVISDGTARLNDVLATLDAIDQAAASDFERIRARLPRAQALLLANRPADAAELLRPWVTGEPSRIDRVESRLLQQLTYAAAAQAFTDRDNAVAARCADRAERLRSEMQLNPTSP
jgi:tetratricopeptide (TPR) repeat protein